jgi:hypothetical protein
MNQPSSNRDARVCRPERRQSEWQDYCLDETLSQDDVARTVSVPGTPYLIELNCCAVGRIALAPSTHWSWLARARLRGSRLCANRGACPAIQITYVRAKAVPGGSVQRDGIRTAGKACVPAIAHAGRTDTTFFIPRRSSRSWDTRRASLGQALFFVCGTADRRDTRVGAPLPSEFLRLK